MAFSDLRGFVEKLREEGELKIIENADWKLEIGTITEMMAERKGPALLFDKISGYPPGYRCLTNFFNTPRRVAIALGLPYNERPNEIVRALKERMKAYKPVSPKQVSDANVKENILKDDKVDLYKFPVPLWHEKDGGRYVGTADAVIMRDPDSGWVNIGCYRVMIHDKKTLGLHISPGHHGRIIREKYWAQGKSCPVAIVFGLEPATWLPAGMKLPWGTSEYEYASFLRGEPVQVFEGGLTGLPIPTSAEIVIEGECPPYEVESRQEGPFGEFLGYYASGVKTEPVVRVKSIMHRNDPILTGAQMARPDVSDTSVHHSALLWNEIERAGIPGVVGVWQMECALQFIIVISVKQSYAGQAKRAAMATLASDEGGYLGNIIILVDDDIDPTNTEDVLWAVSTRCDFAKGLDIVSGCWGSALDPRLSVEDRKQGKFNNNRVIIDACRPFERRMEFPEVSRASNALRAKITAKFNLKV